MGLRSWRGDRREEPPQRDPCRADGRQTCGGAGTPLDRRTGRNRRRQTILDSLAAENPPGVGDLVLRPRGWRRRLSYPVGCEWAATTSASTCKRFGGLAMTDITGYGFRPLWLTLDRVGPFQASPYGIDFTAARDRPCNIFLLTSQNGRGKTSVLER